MYVIFFTVFVNPQTDIVTISDITPSLFDQLRHEHGETLSCPCSTTIISYENFVLNTLSTDPICSSIFVSKEWVQSFYIPYASSFPIIDFRTTAYSQFELLAAFCSFSQEFVSQVLTDINQQQLLTIELLVEDEVQSQVIENIKLIRANTYVQISSSLNFMQIITQSNSLISALNTNAQLLITTEDLSILTMDGNQILLLAVKPTVYYRKNMPNVLYSVPYDLRDIYDNYWPDTPLSFISSNISGVVDGFLSGCTPFDGLLTSTLDCLYSNKCLEQLINYFPNLNQTNFNFTDPLLLSNRQNNSLYERLTNLFIEDWSPTINYSKYFTNCAPLQCTYTTTDQNSLSYTVIFLLSLYGGLTIMFRLIAPAVIHSLLTFGIKLASIREVFQWIKQINLFKSSVDQNTDATKKQYLITRVYLILLAGSILTLLLFTSLSTHITTMTVSNPSIDVYRNLQDIHQDTLKCPCSTATIPYETFISLSPNFHQVCSSDFVNDTWITFLSLIRTGLYNDWPTRAVHQFRLLSTICELINKTVVDAVQRLIIRSLVTSNVLSETDFIIQSNTTVNQFIQLTIINFGLLLDTEHLFLQVDQPFKVPDYVQESLYEKTTDLYNPDLWKLIFSFTGMFNTTGVFNNCVCAINPYCQRQSGLYNPIITSNNTSVSIMTYAIPGSIDGCYALDSFLFSSLECFYSNSDCLSILLTYMNTSYNVIDTEIPWFSPEPLKYDPLSNHFLPNTSLSDIIKEMMIEQWNYEASFNLYYKTCAPNYCTYSYTARTYNYIGVITKIISTIGGLIIALRFITPHMVNFIYQFFQTKIKTSKQNKFFTRMKILFKNLLKLLYTELITLTIFPSYSFGQINDRIKAKRLNQLASRLYVLLLITGVVILSLQTLVQPEILTKTYTKPSLETYEYLLENHGDTLHCPCSITSSTYGKYIKIEPIFHQVCSSQFISNEWRINTTTGLVSNLSNYDRRDYRRFLSAHLQYLAGLCDLSNQSVNAFIQQFLSSLFVTIQLLPKSVLNTQMDALIEENKSNAPVMLLRFLSLHRDINHGNAIISAYGTNYEYFLPERSSEYKLNHYVMRTQEIVYDNNCSCALNASCTISASFIQTNSSEIIPIQGLRMGCTPTESFFASTLECFYNLSCINLIYEHINYSSNVNNTNVLEPPSINTPVIDLINKLFIDNWSITINYTLYFNQCLPTVCSYTYIQRLNSLYTITRLLGLCGGLTVVLKWICPIFICLLAKIYERWKKKKRINRIEPIYFIPTENSEVTRNTHDINQVDNINPSIKPIVIIKYRLQRHTVFFGIGLFILLITIVTIPSVYFTQREKNTSVSSTVVSVINTTIPSVNENISETTAFVLEKTCQLTFKSSIISSYGSFFFSYFIGTGDFNEDNYLDLVVLISFKNNISILLNSGNETFGQYLNISNIVETYGNYIVVADVNNDSRLDLITSGLLTNNLQVLLGIGNGSFEQPSIISPGPSSFSQSIAIGDFNGDDRLDVISSDDVESYVGIVFGVSNGIFENRMTLSIGNDSISPSVVVGDFNNDQRLDFVVVVDDASQMNINLFLGNGNGKFQNQTTLSIGYQSLFGPFVAADFNNDDYLDIAIFDTFNRELDVFLGNGDASFRPMLTFTTAHYNNPQSMIAADFNGDQYLDIAFANDYTADVGIMVGNGNGTFRAEIHFSIGNVSTPQMLTVGDFNNDGRSDIVVATNRPGQLIILWNTCECCSSTNSD
ncbi:unnamed protein product [Adineta steineri]|uniref:Uncharacterized protein n=3 Tax=Adineta steineri TaxID=433720 RepID=A0A815KCL0_9BILA|nr:unnamed protein product [Adineta steineri]